MRAPVGANKRAHQNIARIANAVQCHSKLSGNKDCHELRFSIVRIVISVTNATSLLDCLCHCICSKEVPKKFHRSSKEVPKKFQRSSKEVPKKFQRSSKEFQKKFQRSSQKRNW